MKLSSYEKMSKVKSIIANMSINEIIGIMTRMLDDRPSSSFGISWEMFPSINEAWNDICYGKGMYVAVGTSKVILRKIMD